jgi:radical SAM protein with 4Fe4S-binding SPASM domain
MFPMKNKKIIDAWHSEQFERFRVKQENSCKGCVKKENCFGGCTLFNSVDLCNKIGCL